MPFLPGRIAGRLCEHAAGRPDGWRQSRSPGLGEARGQAGPRTPPFGAAIAPAPSEDDRRAGRPGAAPDPQPAARPSRSAPGPPPPFLAVGDPSVADFFQVGPRQLRLIGKRLGTTDLSVTDGSGKTYDFEVQVVADLDILRRPAPPDVPRRRAEALPGPREDRRRGPGPRRGAGLADHRDDRLVHPVGPGDPGRRARWATRERQAQAERPRAPPPGPRRPGDLVGARPARGSRPAGPSARPRNGASTPAGGGVAGGAIVANSIATNQAQVINLIRVPTSQQVLLKVRVAELNRTAFRQIGADFLAEIPQFGDPLRLPDRRQRVRRRSGRQHGVPIPRGGTSTSRAPARPVLGSQATVFGTFSNGQFNTVLNALRRNNLLKILAEPNLVALNGYQANFLAGGEFPVPRSRAWGRGPHRGRDVEHAVQGVRRPAGVPADHPGRRDDPPDGRPRGQLGRLLRRRPRWSPAARRCRA